GLRKTAAPKFSIPLRDYDIRDIGRSRLLRDGRETDCRGGINGAIADDIDSDDPVEIGPGADSIFVRDCVRCQRRDGSPWAAFGIRALNQELSLADGVVRPGQKRAVD